MAVPPSFPEKPKPPLVAPISVRTPGEPPPNALVGTLPRMPNGPLPPAMGGTIGPLNPGVPLPTEEPTNASLSADEATIRRLVIAGGGRIVSSADAKDVAGKVGRNIVVEASAATTSDIASALRRALEDRVVLSKGGLVETSTPEIRKAEDVLSSLREKRDKARVDFLPQAPILLDLEESTRAAERALARLKRAASRQRLNVLLRPAAGV